MSHDFQSDIDAIASIEAVPTILDVVCRITGMGFAAVARVTEDRWIACSVLDKIAFGLTPGGELKVATTICDEIRESGKAVVIDHVAEDDTYCGHPTPAMYGFQSYISMPIVLKDGAFFGTLCAIDPRPAQLKNPETIGMFKLFAELIAAHLDSGRQLSRARAELAEEKRLAELREQFMAVLGHDLRNPVAAVDSGAKLLLRGELREDQRRIVERIGQSVARVVGLIVNVLDFARTRLGEDMALTLDSDRDLRRQLEHVVAEFRAIEPDRRIETDFALDAPVRCDPDRIGQLLSNLLGNALVHGAGETPVRTGAATANGVFELWVSNSGAAIPKEILPNLFQPYVRGQVRPGQQGLGLGLFIASEIARAHGGTLEANSTPAETRFTFRMPVA